MITNKTSQSILGMAFVGLVISSLAGIAWLAVLVDELAESGRTAPSFMQAYFFYGQILQNSTGNEFTGEATALLFGASTVPVVLDLIARTITRDAPLGERVKGFIRRINSVQ